MRRAVERSSGAPIAGSPLARVDLSSRRWRRVATIAALVITAYGGLLRIEALIEAFGPSGQPEWSAALGRHVVPVARRLRPASVVWGPVPHPYINGDPINYIRYAREMRHFYQAHVREPVFLALTRGCLWLTGGRDIAVSYASATSGTLAVFATYLVGAAAFSPWVGLGAALALAIEFQAILQGIEGWRDDTFMLFVALSAWAMIRLHQMPTPPRAAVAGVMCAAACLTRITALSFIIPGLLWLVLDGPASQRATMAKCAATAAALAALIVAPYLINCAIETGDAFYAINYHTRFYRAAEGTPFDQPQSALAYVAGKLRTHPFAAADTMFRGVITWPFLIKWNGFGWWAPWIGPLLRWSAAVGVAAAVWSATGRFLLVTILTSLVPYALTWSIKGGGEWRFTQHVYPLYLVLALWPIVQVATAARLGVRTSERTPVRSREALVRAAIVLAVVTVGWTAYLGFPVLTAHEALRKGEPVTIAAGERDRFFFKGAWSPPVGDQRVVVRIAESDVVAIRLPMAPGSDYLLTVRADPAETADPADQPQVAAFLNGRAVLQLRMTRDPTRMGTYRVRVPRDAIRTFSHLNFIASRTVRAADAGAPFRGLPSETRVAFRLWYVRLEPIPLPTPVP